MPYKPERLIGEILGLRARSGFDAAHSNFLCPFTTTQCSKNSTLLGAEPYPVCSLWLNRPVLQAETDLICVCPKRFLAVDFLRDAVKYCWPGSAPENIRIAREVQMKGFGNIDFVVANFDSIDGVEQFLSVELQAIDITGSVMKAYKALREGAELPARPTQGFNWDNVYKRYITQLVRKGYFHHHWKTKIVSVIQEQVYRNVVQRASFMRSKDVKDNPDIDIIFMTYRFEDDPARPGEFKPVLATVEGTAHSSLLNAMMYKQPPARDEFLECIRRSIKRI